MQDADVGKSVKEPEAIMPFETVRAGDMQPTLEAIDFVEDVFTEGGASVVYGSSNVGKSFWILDIAAHVATGKSWRFDEHQVDQGAVIYVALEGTQGIRNRIEAMKREDILPENAPLYLVFSKVSLLEPGDDLRMAETVTKTARDCGEHARLIVIDTLSRALAGGDENGSRDMTTAVASVDSIRALTGAHVCLIHHCGKDEAKGSRGHSSLRAAVDTEIELYRADGESCVTASVKKQREIPFSGPWPFSLKSIELGTNRRGKPVTSCVVKQEDDVLATERGKPGRPPSASNEELLSLLPAVSTTEWQKRADSEYGVSKSSFHRLRGKLQGNGAIRKPDGGWVRSA